MNNFWMGLAYGMIGLWAANIYRYMKNRRKRKIQKTKNKNGDLKRGEK